MKGFPDLPPIWLVVFMAMAWAFARFGSLATTSSSALEAFGIVVAATGLGLIVWSAGWFWRKKTTIEPHHTPSTLIVEGPYRLSRNPIYLGMVLILTGQVLWLSALSPALLPPIFLIVLTERFVKPEEAALTAAFGASGTAYMAATRRWI
jgi:protein-S-isoprenylcysteine O-methyltransferase Ste14